MTSDKITMLRCLDGCAVKTFKADGTVQPYRAGKNFQWTDVGCSSLDDLFGILLDLQSQRGTFVVRGEAIDKTTSSQWVRRRVNGNDATFQDCSHYWVMLDVDGVVAPTGIDPTSGEALEYVLSLLPHEFQGVSFISQWSSSAGLKPGVIKVHLWFWLETALNSATLRRWAMSLPKLANGARLIDPAVFNAVQPHYTASPIFESLADPVPVRTLHVKLDRHSVRLVVDEWQAAPQQRQVVATGRVSTSLTSDGKLTDGREEWLRNERYRILRDDNPSDFQEFATAAWHAFDLACATGATSTSNNVYTENSVGDKCRYDWDKYQRQEFDFQTRPSPVLAPFPDRTVSHDIAADRLTTAIRAYLSTPNNTVIKITSGAGKTTSLCNELVKVLQAARNAGEAKVAHFYLSTHELKNEIASRLATLDRSLKIANIMGRIRGTCERHELTSSLRELRVSIQRTCCDASSEHDSGFALFTKEKKCPDFDNCRYQKQFENAADIYLFSKVYLQAGRRSDVAAPDFVIIDEEFIRSLVEVREAGLEDLLKLPPTVSSATRLAVQTVRDALAAGDPVLARLKAAGFGAVSLRQCAHDINRFRQRKLRWLLPGMPPEVIAAGAMRAGPEHVAFMALTAISHEMGTSRDESYSVVYSDSRLFVRLLRDSPALSTPTLVLDATADEELTRVVLPGAHFHAIELARNAHVVQIRDRRLSRFALTKHVDKDRNLALVQASLDRITARYKSGLLVTFIDVENAFHLPHEWNVAHFGNIRGIDAHKDLEAVVLVGTYLPPVQSVEHEAGALAARLPEERDFQGSYTTMERAFRLREGMVSASIWGHPDAFAQRVLEQKREAEMLQAIDRLRLVHAPSKKPVFILSNLPLDIAVNETVTLGQLAGEDDLVGQLLDHFGGAIPLRGALLHEHRPDLFPTEKAAEKWAGPFTPRGLISTIRPGGVKELRAKGIGQKGPKPTRVLIRGDHPAPRGLVEYLLGDLASYDGPDDGEVYVHATMPQTGRVVSARVLQFVEPWIAPNGLVQMEMPPDVYRVFNPPKWKERWVR
jgi:hypothetical protein